MVCHGFLCPLPVCGERTFFREGDFMMKKSKKLLALSLAAAAVFAVNAPAADAAYSLNSEVTTATPSLKQASQIGVLTYENENPAFKKLANKDAILVMSFGTTFKDSREKTIDATVKAISAAHPGTKVVTAFTSHIIIDRIAKGEGINYPTPEKALEQLKQEGYTRVALVSLDVIPGMEYEYDKAVFHAYKDQFKKMTLGTSLLYWQGQEEQPDDVAEFADAVTKNYRNLKKDEAVLLLAHGTPQPANAYYSVLQAKLYEAKINHVYVYTVEGWPNLETVMAHLNRLKIKNVTLVPMMMVAGDHANNDMAGDEEDSHKKILQKAGFNVKTEIKGLGENPDVRALFVKRANDAWDALQAK